MSSVNTYMYIRMRVYVSLMYKGICAYLYVCNVYVQIFMYKKNDAWIKQNANSSVHTHKNAYNDI